MDNDLFPNRKNMSPAFLIISLIILLTLAVIGLFGWDALQSAPGTQLAFARHRWESNAIAHYRMNASYYSNYSQCYYDIEVRQEHLVRIFTAGCLGNAESKTIPIGGIFEIFEHYVTQKVCSPNGCYCEGKYVVQATYDETLGYPKRITTFFRRSWLDDLLHGKIGVQQCLRTDPWVERFDRIKITILP